MLTINITISAQLMTFLPTTLATPRLALRKLRQTYPTTSFRGPSALAALWPSALVHGGKYINHIELGVSV